MVPLRDSSCNNNSTATAAATATQTFDMDLDAESEKPAIDFHIYTPLLPAEGKIVGQYELVHFCT